MLLMEPWDGWGCFLGYGYGSMMKFLHGFVSKLDILVRGWIFPKENTSAHRIGIYIYDSNMLSI